MLHQIENAFRGREASEARLRRFVADASHELRTPLTTIRGYAELFRQGAVTDPEEQTRALERIETESVRMGVLVDDLLLLARLDQQRPLEREPVDLTHLAERGRRGRPSGRPGPDVRARRRPSRTRSARRRRPPAPGARQPARERARALPAGNDRAGQGQHGEPRRPGTTWVQVDVTDDGPGLDPDQLSRVFERFYRADGARTGGGSGLGLSIVQAVVEAHGGQVGCSSVLGRGRRSRSGAPDLPGGSVRRIGPFPGCVQVGQVSFGDVGSLMTGAGFHARPRRISRIPSATRRQHPVRAAELACGRSRDAAGRSRCCRVLLRRVDGVHRYVLHGYVLRVAALGGAAAGGPGGAFGAAFEKYTDCLTQHGVTLPSGHAGARPSNFPSGARPSNFPSGVRPSGGFRGGFGGGAGAFSSTAPSGVSANAWASAQQACASVRPSFTPGAGAGGGGVDATAVAAYLSCLKDHGVKVTGTGLAALRSINRSEPAVAKALTTCQPLLPSRTAATPTPSAS